MRVFKAFWTKRIYKSYMNVSGEEFWKKFKIDALLLGDIEQKKINRMIKAI
jgi:hypothetical protein